MQGKAGGWAQQARPALHRHAHCSAFCRGPSRVTWLHFRRKWSATGFEKSIVFQRVRFWPGGRSWVRGSGQGPAGEQSQSRLQWSAVLQGGSNWTGAGLTPALCPFPLPDQHWSDDSPSDAETKPQGRHLEVAEAEQELKLSGNEEGPPATLPRHQRGQSAGWEAACRAPGVEPPQRASSPPSVLLGLEGVEGTAHSGTQSTPRTQSQHSSCGWVPQS